MSFTISRNKMTFASTEARSSLKITTTDDKAIEKGTTHVIATLSFNANDAIHHGHALIACSFPSTPVAQLPSLSLTCTAGGYVETIPFTVAMQSDNFMRGHCVLSQCSAYTEVKVNITAQAGAHFIAKANTAIHVSLEPNDALLTESIMPVPPALGPSDFTMSNTSGYYIGLWEYAGNVRRVGPSFGASADIGIYRHTYGSDVYVLYYFAEGVAQSPTWALTKFGNNSGANAIAPDHNFLSSPSMTGLHIEYVSGSSQVVNGTQYPPSNALGGTMVIG